MVRRPHWQNNTNVWFSVFLDFRKVGKFTASIERPNAKSISASGRLRPLTSWPKALPLDPAGGFSLIPRYRLALRARHGLPPPFSNTFCGLCLALQIMPSILLTKYDYTTFVTYFLACVEYVTCPQTETERVSLCQLMCVSSSSSVYFGNTTRQCQKIQNRTIKHVFQG